MQRRAVAVYVALFLLVGTASYALIATADSPEVAFDDPEHELQEGDEFSVDGQQYAVTSVERQEEEDHGQVEVTYTGEIEWEEVQEQSEQWADGDTVELDDAQWTVETGDGVVQLRHQQDREAILRNDETAADETVESEGEVYVVVTNEEGERTLVHEDDYFPEPEVRQYEEGDTFDYDGQEALVEGVADGSAQIVWEGPVTETSTLENRENVTIQGQEYIVFFQDEETIVLDTDHEAYQSQLAEMETHQQRVDGLERVISLSGLVMVLLSAMAFLPPRY